MPCPAPELAVHHYCAGMRTPVAWHPYAEWVPGDGPTAEPFGVPGPGAQLSCWQARPNPGAGTDPPSGECPVSLAPPVPVLCPAVPGSVCPPPGLWLRLGPSGWVCVSSWAGGGCSGPSWVLRPGRRAPPRWRSRAPSSRPRCRAGGLALGAGEGAVCLTCETHSRGGGRECAVCGVNSSVGVSLVCAVWASVVALVLRQSGGGRRCLAGRGEFGLTTTRQGVDPDRRTPCFPWSTRVLIGDLIGLW